MIIVNGVELRNLEEQVQKNKEDIAAHYNVDRVLADFGIRVVGQVATAANLPSEETYVGDYGNAYAVGTSSPYSFYIWTRADVDAGHPNDYWFNIGPLGIVGPTGPRGGRGPTGPKGDQGLGITVSTVSPPQVTPSIRNGDSVLIAGNTNNDGKIYTYNGTSFVQTGNIRGPIGPEGKQGPKGDKGDKGDRGETGATGPVGPIVNILGILSSVSELPSDVSALDANSAYLVGTESTGYDVYALVGAITNKSWTKIGQFTAGTVVYVNNAPVATVNMNDYLKKATLTGQKLIYGTTTNAVGTYYYLADNNTSDGFVPQRKRGGNIIGPDQINGSQPQSRDYITREFMDTRINNTFYVHLLTFEYNDPDAQNIFSFKVNIINDLDEEYTYDYGYNQDPLFYNGKTQFHPYVMLNGQYKTIIDYTFYQIEDEFLGVELTCIPYGTTVTPDNWGDVETYHYIQLDGLEDQEICLITDTFRKLSLFSY